MNLNTGDSGFTVDGAGGVLTVPSTTIYNGANGITLRNLRFTDTVVIDGLTNSNVLIEHNDLTWNAVYNGGQNSKIHLQYGASAPSGVTIKDNLIANGNLDGIQSGLGVNIIGNEIRNIIDTGTNHADAVQIFGSGSLLRGNYIHNNTDGLVAFDRLANTTFEDNVVTAQPDPDGIDCYSCQNIIVRHNTILGDIYFDHKSADPVSSGEQIYDNFAFHGVVLANGSSATRNDHNLNGSGVLFLGGASPSTYAGFYLAPGSSGTGAASDGLDVGIR